MTTFTRARRPLRAGVLLPAVLALSAFGLAACAADEDPDGSASADVSAGAPSDDASVDASVEGSAAGGGEITVGGANFAEMNIMEEIYAALLTDAGYTVDIITAENRELYAQSLIDGQIDVVPEYAATFAEYVNREVNGPDAAPIATADAAETVAAASPLAEGLGLVILDPAEAADQNGFAVSAAFAEANSLSTLSDLAALGQPVRLAATEECPERPFCQLGLEGTYGLTISELLPLGFGSPQAKQAVVDGSADLVLTGTTDGTLEGLGLVLLEDDKGLQQADNLVPVVNSAAAEDQTLVDTLNSLADVLTTEDLAALNVAVDVDREQAADVALAYLQEKGLVG